MMLGINSELLYLARQRLERNEKSAFVPAGGGAPPGDPAAAGGGMPMDPAAMGGVDPAAMMAAMPPAGGPSPAAMAGVPMDPNTGQPLGPITGQPVGAPAAAPAGGAGGQIDPATGAKKPTKIDPALIDQRMYVMQSQLTAIMNHLGLSLPPEAAMMPPAGSPPPQFEQALPGAGGPVDMATQQAAPGGAPGAPPGGAPAGPVKAGSVADKLAVNEIFRRILGAQMK